MHLHDLPGFYPAVDPAWLGAGRQLSVQTGRQQRPRNPSCTLWFEGTRPGRFV